MVPVTKWHSAIGDHTTIWLPDVSDNRMPTVLWIASSNHELSLFKKYSFFDLIQKTTQKKYYKTRNHFLHDHVQQTHSC